MAVVVLASVASTEFMSRCAGPHKGLSGVGGLIGSMRTIFSQKNAEDEMRSDQVDEVCIPVRHRRFCTPARQGLTLTAPWLGFPPEHPIIKEIARWSF